MTDHLTEARERNEKATVACVLGSVAFACIVALAIGTIFDQGWLMEPSSAAWLLLPFVAFTAGIVAVFVGAAAWVDARQGKSGNGLRQAQVGSILGGTALGAIIATLIVLFVIFIFFVIATSNESDGSSDRSTDHNLERLMD